MSLALLLSSVIASALLFPVFSKIALAMSSLLLFLFALSFHSENLNHTAEWPCCQFLYCVPCMWCLRWDFASVSSKPWAEFCLSVCLLWDFRREMSWPFCSRHGKYCFPSDVFTGVPCTNRPLPEAWLISKAVLLKGSLFSWAWMLTGPTRADFKTGRSSRLQAVGQDAGSWGRKKRTQFGEQKKLYESGPRKISAQACPLLTAKAARHAHSSPAAYWCLVPRKPWLQKKCKGKVKTGTRWQSLCA